LAATTEPSIIKRAEIAINGQDNLSAHLDITTKKSKTRVNKVDMAVTLRLNIFKSSSLVKTKVYRYRWGILLSAFVCGVIPTRSSLWYSAANSATMREFGLWLSNNLLFFSG
jgi:hypothetical protein